ncbi:MAG TPA: hypothetical protein VFK62_04160 [Gaiellaceae bacterium]|nr:hypothetical protein [Gaiellaceae bacterium]
MAIADKIETYEVHIAQNNFLDYNRSIRLSLESGGTAFIGFPAVRPADWLQFNGNSTVLYMTADEFTDVYHLLQSEAPVFFTAIDLFGLEVGAVHTELDLAAGEPPGEGDEDHTQSLAALVRRAQQEEAKAGAVAG